MVKGKERIIIKEIDNLGRVNNGGCAIVAYGLVKHVEKFYPKKRAQVVYLFGKYDESYDNLKNNVSDSCGHAVVKIGEKYFDSTGTTSLENLKKWWSLPQFCEVDLELVGHSINHACWNPSFNREQCVPEIFRILKLPFEEWEDIDLEHCQRQRD